MQIPNAQDIPEVENAAVPMGEAPDAIAVKDPEPSETISQEAPSAEDEPLAPAALVPEDMYPIEAEDAAPPKRVRPERIMGIIAILAAALLLTMAVLCIPYFNPSEDPEALPQRHDPVKNTEALLETILEPTISETEPENPTIPPDPNPYDRYDFQYNRNNYLLLQNLKSNPGVDVSAYQGDINWKAVKSSGIDFHSPGLPGLRQRQTGGG